MALTFAATTSRAEDQRLPEPSVLVRTVTKAAEYDRHLAARANGHVRTMIVFRSGDAASEKTAHDLARFFGSTEKIAGWAHEESVDRYSGANALAAEIRSQQVSIVVLSTGLGDEAPAIAHELDGIDVLSVAVDPDDVPKGIVFGVDARAGSPTLVIRLAQARRQNVAFEASLLKLARIE